MGNLLFDLRFALRNLARRPGFAAVSILTLALGVGAATSIFAVARGVVLRPLPYPDPDELVVVWETHLERELPKMFAAPPNLHDWARDPRSREASLDGLAAFDGDTFLLAGEDAEAETLEVRGARVTAGLFSTLGVDPLLGRPFEASEDRPGGEAVALVGHDLWRRRFGADPELPGKVVSLDGAPHRVVGVLHRGFSFP
jgi:putative ABC transport system permease protein